MLAQKLRQGSEVRVISPSLSLGIISEEQIEMAKTRLGDMGLIVSFGEHASDIDEFNSSPVSSRVQDLHDAFADPNVSAILTTIGGLNCNQMLREVNYQLDDMVWKTGSSHGLQRSINGVRTS